MGLFIHLLIYLFMYLHIYLGGCFHFHFHMKKDLCSHNEWVQFQGSSHICPITFPQSWKPQITHFICLIAYCLIFNGNGKEMGECARGNWLESKTHLHICPSGTLVPSLWVPGLHQCRGSADEARELTAARGLIPSSIGFIQKATRQEDLIPSCGAPLQRGLLERCCGK